MSLALRSQVCKKRSLAWGNNDIPQTGLTLANTINPFGLSAGHVFIGMGKEVSEESMPASIRQVGHWATINRKPTCEEIEARAPVTFVITAPAMKGGYAGECCSSELEKRKKVGNKDRKISTRYICPPAMEVT